MLISLLRRSIGCFDKLTDYLESVIFKDHSKYSKEFTFSLVAKKLLVFISFSLAKLKYTGVNVDIHLDSLA